MTHVKKIIVIVLLAGMCSGGMDVIKFKWNDSVFAKVQNNELKQWFKSEHQHKFKEWSGIPLHPIFYDGWHFFKNLWVLLMTLGLVQFLEKKRDRILLFVIINLLWWLSFNVFYEVVFIASP